MLSHPPFYHGGSLQRLVSASLHRLDNPQLVAWQKLVTKRQSIAC